MWVADSVPADRSWQERMPFKDKLKAAIEARGGNTQENLSHIPDLARTVQLSVWKPPNDNGDVPRLQWANTRRSRHRIQNASFLPRERLRLIADALASDKVESGFAPVVDTRHGAGRPIDVPAEALAWGRGEYRQVMVFYYSLRSQTGHSHSN